MSVKVRQRGDVYWIFVDHRGRRKAKKIGPGRRGKALAEDLRAQWAAWITLGEDARIFAPVAAPSTTSPFPTLRDALLDWIERKEKSGDLRGASGAAYRAGTRTWIVGHVLPDGKRLGDLPMDQVTREMLGSAITTIKTAGKSRSTIEHARNALRGFFRGMTETRQLTTNPAADLGYFVGKVARGRKTEIFTRDECATLLRAAEGSRLHAFVATALGTGCRWGELAALTRDDIDLDQRRIHVSKSWSLKAGKVEPTKTGAARFVPLSAELAAILRDRLETRSAEGWGQDALLFPGPNGGHLRHWAGPWRALLKRAGIPYRKFHATRHTFASHALRAGIRPELVQRWLGHSTLTMTLDTYRTFIPDHAGDTADAAKLGELLS